MMELDLFLPLAGRGAKVNLGEGPPEAAVLLLAAVVEDAALLALLTVSLSSAPPT